MPAPKRLPLDLPAAAPAAAASNVPELTVGELSGALKRTIEDRFGFVRVRGEISNYRGPHASGHAYFCLKDDAARIDAVVWRTAFQRLRVKPQEGLEVVATGRVTTFPGKSTYQLVIETIEPAGVGALMALLEARRKTLGAEGLFDDARKRPLPYFAQNDRRSHVADRRGDPRHPASSRRPVPARRPGLAGARAGRDGGGRGRRGDRGVQRALRSQGAIRRPDVLIVARGGGSLEDLWAFNEEVVVRAAAASAIPLIAAVGHETDWTLIDHAADLRAPTPSGAAEKAVPVRRDLLIQGNELGRRHAAAILRLVERRRTDVRALARALPAAETVVAVPRQRLDRAEGRLAAALAGARDQRHLALARLAQRLSQQAPRAKLARMRQQLAGLEQTLVFCVERTKERRRADLQQRAHRLASAAIGIGRGLAASREREARAGAALDRVFRAAVERRHERVERLGKLLGSLGYRNVLARGFALVRDGAGRPVRSVGEVEAHAALDIELADGHIDVLAAPRRPAARRPRPKAEQGSLF